VQLQPRLPSRNPSLTISEDIRIRIESLNKTRQELKGHPYSAIALRGVDVRIKALRAMEKDLQSGERIALRL